MEDNDYDKPKLPDAAFLREVASRMFLIPATFGVDQCDIDRLEAIAAAMEADHGQQAAKPHTPRAATEPKDGGLQAPIVHLNGSGMDNLIDGLCGASQALNGAYEVMRRICPNGRDYYPLGAVAMGRAEAEHRSRLERLDAIKAEIDAIAEAIADQG